MWIEKGTKRWCWRSSAEGQDNVLYRHGERERHDEKWWFKGLSVNTIFIPPNNLFKAHSYNASKCKRAQLSGRNIHETFPLKTNYVNSTPRLKHFFKSIKAPDLTQRKQSWISLAAWKAMRRSFIINNRSNEEPGELKTKKLVSIFFISSS